MLRFKIFVFNLLGSPGSGKTTLLKRVLSENHGMKIAVIENEFGEVAIDNQLIGDRATQIKTLTNGCICCTRSNELEDALLDLLDSENELFTAQRRLQEVKFIELFTQYRIKATMGTLLKSQGVVAPMAATALDEVKSQAQLPGLN